MKAAMTLDGQIAAADGSSQWITGREARAEAHLERAEVDAVMVGAGTVLADDPRLDVRLDDFTGTQPTPVVVVGRRPLPPDSQIFARRPIVFSPNDVDLPSGVIVLPDESGESVDLVAALEHLSDLGIEDVLVEGGAGLLSGLLAGKLIDRGIAYFGAKLAGGVGIPLFQSPWSMLEEAHRIEITSARTIGPDARVDFSFRPN